jgi:hypothetical protein
MATSTTADKRYTVSFLVDEFRGHRGVRFCLFHHGDVDEAVYRAWTPPGGDPEDPCFRSFVDDTFTADEVAALRQWCGHSWRGVSDFCVTAVSPPDEPDDGLAGLGARRAVGGHDDFYMFDKCDGYPLPFKVWGYCDLAEAESGPYVTNPNLVYWRLSVSADGKVVVQPPPF